MNIKETVTAVGLAVLLAGTPMFAYAASSSPQKAMTGVGQGAGNAAGGVFDGKITTSTAVTGLVVLTAVGVAIAAATDDNDEIENQTPSTTTTTTTTTTTSSTH
jgi:hypothetical protein